MVNIINNGAYIKVEHSDGVVIYYVKASLVLQKQSADTFMMKCDSIEKYYKFHDVIEPLTYSVDELLDLIASWNTALSNKYTSMTIGTLYFAVPP